MGDRFGAVTFCFQSCVPAGRTELAGAKGCVQGTVPGFDVELVQGREIGDAHAEAIHESLGRRITRLPVRRVEAKASLCDEPRIGTLVESLLDAAAQGVRHQRGVRKENEAVAGPVQIRREDIGGDALRPQGAINAAKISIKPRGLVVEAEQLL